ncbi:RPA2B [Symbiodinium natans]|uniref:RPA2B protein n=1 Tax=Symbiodinium natans TaxID=878477 RepID=A0A812QW37_9DINO|nr:RPA2B [Symbiodinium natans]
MTDHVLHYGDKYEPLQLAMPGQYPSRTGGGLVGENMFGGGGFGAPQGGYGGYGAGYGGVGGGGYGGVEPAGQGGPCGGVQASQGHGGFIIGDNAGSTRTELPGAGSGKTSAQTLTPVTIRMLLDAVSSSAQLGPDGAFCVNGGRELQMLTVVACVEGIRNQQMGISLTLNDGTGRISCNMYSDSDPASAGPEFQDGDYIRVFGQLRQWDQQEGITAHRIVKVESANEIAYHTIEVAHVHLSVTGKLVKSGANGATSGQANRMSASTPTQAGGARHTQGGPGFFQPPTTNMPPPGGAQGSGPGFYQPPTTNMPPPGGAQGSGPGFYQPPTTNMPPPGGAQGSGPGFFQPPTTNMPPPGGAHGRPYQPPMASMPPPGGAQGSGPGTYQPPMSSMPPPGGAQGSGLYGGNSLYGTSGGPGVFR